MTARVMAAIVLATTSWWAHGAAAQDGDQSPTASDAGVRGRIEQVRVEVRVTDDRGNPVTNLQRLDFEITDEGKRQAIVSFTLITAGSPPSTSQTQASPRTTAPPDAPTSVPPSGRVVVVVLDDLHVAPTNTPRVKEAVRSYIESVMSAADSIAVVFTSGANGGGQEFTSDRRLVLTAVDRFRGQKLRSATVERLQDPHLNLRGVLSSSPDPNQPDRANRARITLDALRRIGDSLVALEDRRPMVLFVSEGPEYEVVREPRTNQSDQWSINADIRNAVETLNRVNAVVFAIDPRGVSTGNADQIHASSVFETKEIGTSAIQSENVRAFGVVQAVAANTGGFTMLWRPGMSRDFRRVVAMDSSYYLVSYEAPPTDRGKYHNITVRVRKRGLQVNARSGYFLPSGDSGTAAPRKP